MRSFCLISLYSYLWGTLVGRADFSRRTGLRGSILLIDVNVLEEEDGLLRDFFGGL